VTVAIGLALLSTSDPHELLPDDLLRLHRDRPRDRQLVHAAADDRDGRRARQDAGLGSGIVNVSQQVAGLSALPCSADRPPTTPRHSRPTVRHSPAHSSAATTLAFAIGAASVVVAIVTALVVLRPLADRRAAGRRGRFAAVAFIAGEPEQLLERQAA